MQANFDRLQAEIPNILSAPKDNVPVEMLCVRPDYGQRRFVTEIPLFVKDGIPGERWTKAPWLKRPDGTPDPRIQVSILSRRVLDAVWIDRENTVHPGDTFVVDMDLSEANIPVGSLLQAGSAVLRVSDKFNDGCVKWKTRYGTPAKDWIVHPENLKYRLRGLLCEIVQDGVVRSTDLLRKNHGQSG